MAVSLLGGMGPYYPPIPPYTFGGVVTMINSAVLVIDATGEKIALIGRHFNAARATKSIRKVGVLFGAVTKAGGSGLTLSLQDVSATAGPPIQPDETQDQTVAIAAADVTANTFLLTGNLSADRSVAFGELLAVVLEYDVSGRQGADSFALAAWNIDQNSAALKFQHATVLKTASWALAPNQVPIVLFEYSDGTFGTFADCWPCSGGVLVSVNTGTTPDEYGLEFQVAHPMSVDGAWVAVFITAAADLDVILYEGSTPVANGSVSIDNDQLSADNLYKVLDITFPAALTLATGTTYRLIAKPTTATSIHLPSMDVSVAGHMAAVPGGAAFNSASRTDGGSFTALTTRRPFVGVRIAGLDSGGGGIGRRAGYGGLVSA